MSVIVGAAVGSGLMARACERSGVDFLLAINSGRLRSMGLPSLAGLLPILPARELTESFALREVLGQVQVPVHLGLDPFGAETDPEALAARAAELGFDGVVNFPTNILYPAPMRRILDAAGLGFAREIEILAAARRRGLSTVLYCANRVEARMGADAGLDMIVLNLGPNAGGALGHSVSQTLEEAGFRAREIGRMVKAIHPGAKFLVQGGPVIEPSDLARLLRAAPIDGYVGGSTLERLPVEASVGDVLAGFRAAERMALRAARADAGIERRARRLGYPFVAPAGIACLAALERLARQPSHVVLHHETGCDLRWVLAVLCGRGGNAVARSTCFVDALAAPARQLEQRLFGGPGRGEEPLLATSGAGPVVIENAQALGAATQRRLARAIRRGCVTLRDGRGRRHSLPLKVRLVFLLTVARGGRAPAFEPDLERELIQPPLTIPPLRERREDIPELVAALVRRLAPARRCPLLSERAMDRLTRAEWPGNDRQLERLTAFLLQAAPERPAAEELVERALSSSCPETGAPALPSTPRERILEALWRNGFHRGRTARALGISRKTLYNRIRRLGLDV